MIPDNTLAPKGLGVVAYNKRLAAILRHVASNGFGVALGELNLSNSIFEEAESVRDLVLAAREMAEAPAADQPLVNVKAFGAMGDGATDDHAAIALAVAEVNRSGGTLYFPEGIYLDSAGHTLVGPEVIHPQEENPYRGNYIIAGDGSATVLQYTGSGTFLTVSSPERPPCNLVFRDMQIKGTTSSPWSEATIGIDTRQASANFQFDNLEISNFQIGLRCFDATSVGFRQVQFRHCKIGGAGDFKFDGVVLDRVAAQNCDVGFDLGYYNSSRTYDTSPPPVEGVTLLSPVFGSNRIALIIGGAGSSGITVLGGYFEAQTEANIDIGHNTTDYAGLALEGAAAVQAVSISGCYFQGSAEICRVWCPTVLTFGKNNYNGASAPYVRLKNANADTSTVIAHDAVANVLGYSGGTQKNGPISTGGMTFRGNLIIDSSDPDAIAAAILNATKFPGLQFQLSSVVQGYIVCTGVAGSFLTDSLVGDLVLRSESDRILIGVGAGASTMIVSATQVISSAPVILPTYNVAGVPAAASHTRGLIYVANESGGAVVAFSDGANWRRVTDRAIIS